MRKMRDLNEEAAAASGRGRVLARALAEELRGVKGGGDVLASLTTTDPPPGDDVTFVKSDGGQTY
jgi:hypothetical protein